MKTKKKRGLPNQHGRMSQFVAFCVREAFGTCPGCGSRPNPAVIYRRSRHSITFRCNACTLQWTITLANMHRAAKTLAGIWRDSDRKNAATCVNLYEGIAMRTREPFEDEAKRQNTIRANLDMRKPKKRRVILLGNGER